MSHLRDRLDRFLNRWAGITRRSTMEHPRMPTPTLVPEASAWEVEVPPGFHTPCMRYPLTECGDARLRRYTQSPGIYWAHGVQGASFFRQRESLEVTHLQTCDTPDGEWRTWMVDDPTHWFGLQAYATRIQGPRVLVGGLGLGMIAHLLHERPDITDLTIIERNPNVVQLIEPWLPRDRRRSIIIDDFWSFNETHYAFAPDLNKYDTVFVDLWRGPVAEQLSTVMERVQDVQRCYPWPQTDSLFFFFQDAVDLWRNSEPPKEEPS